jgi:hypothetical protein
MEGQVHLGEDLAGEDLLGEEDKFKKTFYSYLFFKSA